MNCSLFVSLNRWLDKINFGRYVGSVLIYKSLCSESNRNMLKHPVDFLLFCLFVLFNKNQKVGFLLLPSLLNQWDASEFSIPG